MKVYFKDVAVGNNFTSNGNTWLKLSTRTAKPLFSAFNHYYYFKQCEIVNNA